MLKNESYFAYIATADNPKDWKNPVEWQKANPNLGISIYLDGFEEDCKEAEQDPEKQHEFLTKKLNVWLEKQGTPYIALKKYAECDGEIDWQKFEGMRCFGGLDLGITEDISALALAFQGENQILETEDGVLERPNIYLLMRYWIPEEGMRERYHNDGVNYPLWVEQGWITATPGDTTRYDIIRRDINKLSSRFEIAEIAIDRVHAHETMQNLADDGFDIVKHAQTMLAMNFPCRSFKELVLEGRLRHGNDPVLRWMVDNACVLKGGDDNTKVVKDKSKDRVDGVIAAQMAIGRLLIAPEPVQVDYEVYAL